MLLFMLHPEGPECLMGSGIQVPSGSAENQSHFLLSACYVLGVLLTLFYLQPQEASVTGMRRSGLRKFTKLKNQSKSVEAWKDGGDGLIEATSLTPRCPLKGAEQVNVAYTDVRVPDSAHCSLGVCYLAPSAGMQLKFPSRSKQSVPVLGEN